MDISRRSSSVRESRPRVSHFAMQLMRHGDLREDLGPEWSEKPWKLRA